MKKYVTPSRTFGLVLAALSLMLVGGRANALPIDSPVPSSAYIVYDGLEWAWGGPCPYSGGCYATGDLSYQSTLGWTLPSAADLAIVNAVDASNPGAFAAMFLNNPGGNVPAGGSDPVSGAYFAAGGSSTTGSCATPYFNTAATWCDASDGLNGDWAGSLLGDSFAEQLYVNGAAAPTPLPSTWTMLIAGFVGLFGFVAFGGKKRNAAATAAA
ncbi:MAG: hypothetical protein ACLPKH_07480 [Rhodomicrobium sp.]